MFCFKLATVESEGRRSMSEDRAAPKKPWELRYVLLTNTTPRWTQPVSL